MKSWKRIAKPVTDAAMFVLFLLVMGEAKLPGAAHEWLCLRCSSFIRR